MDSVDLRPNAADAVIDPGYGRKECAAIILGEALKHMHASMKPMFLPDVEANLAPSPYTDFIRLMQGTNAEYPQIWHLFAFKPEMTSHLARFTQELMRESSPLTPGLRELIAAYTSVRNECPF